MPLPQNTELRNQTIWDRLRALRATPDKETLLENTDSDNLWDRGGPWGMIKKLAASAALAPSDLIELLKASPEIANALFTASRPEGMGARQAVGTALLKAAQNVAENPVSTALSAAAPPLAAREAAYAAIPPHVLMYMRSFAPGYAGKPWTRVPPAVRRAAEQQFDYLHDTASRRPPLELGEPSEIQEVRKHLSAAGIEVPDPARYAYPEGISGETLGRAFIVPQGENAVRIVDNIKWYEAMGQNPTVREILALVAKNPKAALALLKDGTSGGLAGAGAEWKRTVLRDKLESFATARAHSFPVDWTIQRP